MRVAFFGGTFNPIHIGHLISAIEIKDYFFIDKFIFIPTGVIRKRVKENKIIRYFVPQDVEKMILEKGFYLNE